VDAGFFVAFEMLAQLVGSADAAAAWIIRQLVLDLLKALPETGPSRPVLAKDRVIAERVAKEAKPGEPATNGLGPVRVARHPGDDRDIRIDAMADRHAIA